MIAATLDVDFILSRVVFDSSSGCWQWTGSCNFAGRAIHNGRYAYRISHEVFIGPLEGRQVNHHCDNPRCVNPEHIYAGTQLQNIKDAASRGRLRTPEVKRGEDQWLAYPDAMIDQLRARYAAGEMQKDLAVEYGVSLSQVRRWVSGGDRDRQPIPRPVAQCGTRGGYGRHGRRRETPCAECIAANTAYMKAYKARRLRAAA